MRLTKELLVRLIKEEKQKLMETLEMGAKHPSDVAKRTREVDASKMSSTLEKCVDFYKSCCLKEENLKKELKKIREAKAKLKQKMLKELDS
jgi:hypothetical protein